MIIREIAVSATDDEKIFLIVSLPESEATHVIEINWAYCRVWYDNEICINPKDFFNRLYYKPFPDKLYLGIIEIRWNSSLVVEIKIGRVAWRT